MRISPTRGKCTRCGYTGTRGVLRKHLADCSEPLAHRPGRRGRVPPDASGLLIEVVGRPKAYWLFLGVANDAKLTDIDALLRATWLECCDHLSEFVVGRTRYTSVSSPTFSFGPRPQSMHIQVGKVFRPGVPIEHQYDFGSTTVLDLSLVGPLPIALPSRTAALLANNVAPDFACGECGHPAASVCVECDSPAFLCAACSRRHRRGHMLHRVVNSPRMGICGYDGPGAL